MEDLERIILPEQDDGPAVVLQETAIREIQDTTLADGHAPKQQIKHDLLSKGEDWGDGFIVQEEPVLVTRHPDGSIARTTPLSEIPGVALDNRWEKTEEQDLLEAEPKEKLVPLSRPERQKLVAILAHRLWRYWKERGPQDPRYNPFRDGIPELPSGSPEHLQPIPGTKMYPATDAQIYEYAKKFVSDRTEVIDKQRFGKGQLADLAVRIK